jgi:hypothetical protein
MTDLLDGRLIAESLTKKHPNRRQTTGTTTLKQSQLISRPPFFPKNKIFLFSAIKLNLFSRKILKKNSQKFSRLIRGTFHDLKFGCW